MLLLFLLRGGFTWSCIFQGAPVSRVTLGIFLLASQKYSQDCHITPSWAHLGFTFSFKVTNSELTRSEVHRIIELWDGLSWEGPSRWSTSNFPAMCEGQDRTDHLWDPLFLFNNKILKFQLFSRVSLWKQIPKILRFYLEEVTVYTLVSLPMWMTSERLKLL